MTDLQAAKQLLRDYYAELDRAPVENIAATLQRYVSSDYRWRGFSPFDEQHGAGDVARVFWEPLRHALCHLQRRMDIFIAGRNQIDDFQSTWVVSMGHLLGLFDRAWLGIRPNAKIAMLRYCEFNRVERDRITETAMFFDLPHLMQQTGLDPFAAQTGAPLVQPGPATHDGLCFQPQDPAEGEKTLAAINLMLADLRDWQRDIPIEQELARSWNDDMIWWGPAGIGATCTIPRYVEQHVLPFRSAFTRRVFNGHVCKLAEGKFGGFFGWPNLVLTPTGDFMGMPTSGKPAELRVIDMYRRDGDKLGENWIFADLLHFWKQQGVDILQRMRDQRGD